MHTVYPMLCKEALENSKNCIFQYCKYLTIGVYLHPEATGT